MLSLPFQTIFAVLFPFISGLYDPCTSTGFLGDSCDTDDDCTGLGVVCNFGTCKCHSEYYEKLDTSLTSFNAKYCAKLPDRIGQSCQQTCKQPMFCNTGKCECIRSIIIDDICLAESLLGQSCTKNYECVLPFSFCHQKTCQCMPGTKQVGTTCQAEKNCPTGAKAGQPCVRTMNSKQVIQNHANSASKSDNCSTSPTDNVPSFCYTPDDSLFGFCCPVTCPLGSRPETGYSCDPSDFSANGTSAAKICPDETHYCHRMAGQTFSTTVCCRRPCLDPTPLFLKGNCYERAFLNGPCSLDEQCDGAHGMKCESGFCKCKPGFEPNQTGNQSSTGNPPQICVRICSGSLIGYNGECFKEKLSLQDQCVFDGQCPQGAICFRGRCLCDCAKGFSTVNKQACAKPESRTVKPVELVATTPSAFIDLIKAIFGSQGAG